MQRVPEPELMQDPEQALAYARADFSEPHNRFIELFGERFTTGRSSMVLDLGCGPGDICRRFCSAFTDCRVHGVDASKAMLDLARSDTLKQGLEQRIDYFQAYLPDAQLARQHYDILISNSLLHHLKDPLVIWQSSINFGKPGALVFVMDLLRPDSHKAAHQLVEDYAADEPEILRRDFFNSLLAAYRPDEVYRQLETTGLGHLRIEQVSDRHFIVFGRL